MSVLRQTRGGVNIGSRPGTDFSLSESAIPDQQSQIVIKDFGNFAGERNNRIIKGGSHFHLGRGAAPYRLAVRTSFIDFFWGSDLTTLFAWN